MPSSGRLPLRLQLLQLLDSWRPPTNAPDHWPPYQAYSGKDYNPNLWESFEWNNDFYTRNGVNNVNFNKNHTVQPQPYLPYPDYNSDAWKKEWRGEHVPCEGPRGKLLNESVDDWVTAWPSLPESFPEPVVGDARALGLNAEYCFDRYSRYGPYGYGQLESKGSRRRVQQDSKPEWSSVPWGWLQAKCLHRNRERFEEDLDGLGRDVAGLEALGDQMAAPEAVLGSKAPRLHHRTAVLIRCWEGYSFHENDLESIRALILELSLLSGAEYRIFLLMQVRDPDVEILGHESYDHDFLMAQVPLELHGITILWTERIMHELYPSFQDPDVYWHQYMPLQWFSKTHPEFDFIWNWEADTRYIGNHYHLLEQMTDFARKQPRKYLWERNSRFFVPAIHGTYEQWKAATNTEVEHAVKAGELGVVWGPKPWNHTTQHPLGPSPPSGMTSDEFEWGVGEEADLITLLPIWDPARTGWSMRNMIWNFVDGVQPEFTVEDPNARSFDDPEFPRVPRRAYINTVVRLSKRLLQAMHVENRLGRTMQAEMWPTTVALHHGFKAVYAPHPIWTDRKWPPWYMDAIFNADGEGRQARWGQESDSPYAHDREHNFAGWSWYYASDFPRVLYRRWLGWSATTGTEDQYPNNPLLTLGGDDFETRGVEATGMTGVIGGQGRMCLPGMLLHPVKQVLEDVE